MKIFISIDGTERKGYITHTALDISQICEDAEATEILAPGVLDYIKFEEAIPYLEMVVKKMRHGSKLVIGGTEVTELCKALVVRNIDEETFNQKLYNHKRGIHSLFTIANLLQDMGLIINRKKLEGFTYLVEAERE